MGGAASHTNVTEGEHERDLARTDCPSEGCSDNQSDDASQSSQSSQGSKTTTPPTPDRTPTSSALWSQSCTAADEDDDVEWQNRVTAAMRCEVTGNMLVDEPHSVPNKWITRHPVVR